MTKQETFKRRVRERMLKTGERYGAARRALIRPHIETGGSRRRGWIAEPQHPDDAIAAATGHNWDEWVDLIDAGPGRAAGHTAIASWVRDENAVDGWWAQAVTVGYERITGIRLPGQMPDGTFSVSKSRVVRVDGEVLRALILDDADRADLLPGLDTTLRSKPSAKSLRFGVGSADDRSGVAMFSLDPAPAGRLRLTVTHEKLDSVQAGEHWKEFWGEWLRTVEDVAESMVEPGPADEESGVTA